MWSYPCPDLASHLAALYPLWAQWLSSDSASRFTATEHAVSAPAPDRKRFIDISEDLPERRLAELTHELLVDVSSAFIAEATRLDGKNWLRNELLLRCLPQATVRVTEYPAASPGEIVNHDHVDFAALTLLPPATQSGLEVFVEGSWQVIDPQPDEVMVIAGETAYVFGGPGAQRHRVRSTGSPRWSASIFVNPPQDARLRSGELSGDALAKTTRAIRR